MIQSVAEDLFRYWGNDYKKFRKLLGYVLKRHTRYMFYFRHAQDSKCLRFVWLILLRILKYKSGVQIPPQTKIGKGFRLLHFGSVVIHPDAVIGNNFNMAEGTLIGESFIKGTSGVPTIGDNCCMFANSIVVGGVKISDNVLIAPGAFVNFDVPENSIVIGNPGKIISREDSPTQKYIVYPIEKLI